MQLFLPANTKDDSHTCKKLKLKTNLYSAIKSEDSEKLDSGTARGSMVK